MNPIIEWQEGGKRHAARWRSEAGLPAPAAVDIANERISADAAYALLEAGTAYHCYTSPEELDAIRAAAEAAYEEEAYAEEGEDEADAIDDDRDNEDTLPEDRPSKS